MTVEKAVGIQSNQFSLQIGGVYGSRDKSTRPGDPRTSNRMPPFAWGGQRRRLPRESSCLERALRAKHAIFNRRCLAILFVPIVSNRSWQFMDVNHKGTAFQVDWLSWFIHASPHIRLPFLCKSLRNFSIRHTKESSGSHYSILSMLSKITDPTLDYLND